jgi:hypothetical protein
MVTRATGTRQAVKGRTGFGNRGAKNRLEPGEQPAGMVDQDISSENARQVKPDELNKLYRENDGKVFAPRHARNTGQWLQDILFDVLPKHGCVLHVGEFNAICYASHPD